MDKEGLTWDKVSKEKIITLIYLWMLPCISCAWSYAACSRHLFLFFSLMPDKYARNLVSSLLVKLSMWYMPGDTEEGFPAYGSGFFKEIINRGAQLKLSYCIFSVIRCT